ncbi:MAG: hypothetical protein IK118_03705 [Clostridia bacterium]|nr:hypothetical protein [Clostridia bacterium]
MPKTKPRIARTDIAAAGVFCLLCAALIAAAVFHSPAEDELFYISLSQRLAQGDRLLADDWHLAQLATLLQLPFYRLCTAIAGGTAGILFGMRMCYIAIDLALFCFFYIRLRPQGVWGLAAAALLCYDLFAGLLAVNYYNVGVQGFAAICLILFFSPKEPSRPLLILAGVILSCAVLTEPTLAAVYFIYSCAVLIRRLKEKKTGGENGVLLSGRSWLRISVGVFACAAAFFVYLLLTSDIAAIAENLPNFFSDSEYRMTIFGNYANTALKPRYILNSFGAVNLAALPVLLAVSAVLCAKKRRREQYAAILFPAALLWLISCYVHMLGHLDRNSFKCSSLPIFFFALLCFLISESRDRRMLAILITAALCSVAVDYVSEVTVLYAGRLAYLPAAFFCRELTRELSAANPGRRGAKPSRLPLRAAAILSVAALVLTAAAPALYVNETLNVVTDDLRPVTLAEGPLKGLRQSEENARIYEALLRDLDSIGPDADGTLYVAGMLPQCYLYLPSLRCGAISTWCVEKDIVPRQAAYWALHPDKKPTYVFVPDILYDGAPRTDVFTPEQLGTIDGFIESLGSFTLIEGETGKIYRFG